MIREMKTRAPEAGVRDAEPQCDSPVEGSIHLESDDLET